MRKTTANLRLERVERVPISIILSGFATSLIFGLSFLFTKNAIEHVSVYTLLYYRFALALGFMNLLVGLGLIKLGKARYYKLLLLLLTIFQLIPYFTFEVNGLKFVISAEAGMLVALIPIVVNLLAYLLLREKNNRLHYLLVAIAFLGVLLIVGFEFSTQNFLGKFLLIRAVFSAGFYNIWARKVSAEFTPIQLTYFMMLVGFVYFTALSILRKDFEISFRMEVIVGALYLGILSSAVAFFLVNYMVKRMSPTVTSIFANLTTVISVIAGAILRNETVTPVQIIGMSMVSVLIFFISSVNHRKLRRGGMKDDADLLDISN